jgi:signal transduction histidine kinase
VARATGEFRDGGVVAAAVTSSNTDIDTLRAVAVVSPKFDVNGKLLAVYGLIIAPQNFATDVVVPVFDHVPLFPRYLAATTLGYRAWVWGPETHNRELANLAILDAGYRPLYQTGPMADTADTAPGCVGITMREPALASLTVELSPPLEVSTRWINISMATSQLPFLGATMIGMLVCVGAAALAARREVELARLRSDFVSSISHELRMPLAQILLSGETLSLGRTRSQAERDEAADAIVREAHRLTGLVDNALFFSRVEHHNVHVQPKPVEVLPIANEAAAGVAPLAQGVKASITITIPAGLGALVDRDAFRQVLYNLLENAIKYGPPGQEIIVGGEPTPSDPGRAQIWVDDQGPGIPRGKESVIFEPFVRLPRDRDLRVAGSGLGLAVVRYVLMRHGGEIAVDRGRRGTGSRFTITVPRATTVPSENPSTVQDDQPADGPPFHDAAD